MDFSKRMPGANFWIVTGTLAFLIACYFIYLEYYVPNKESRIVSTRFRVLDQLGDNINAKIESYYNNALETKKKTENETERLYNKYKIGDSLAKEKIVEFLIKELALGEKGKYWGYILNKDLQVIDTKIDPGGSDDSTNKANKTKKEFNRIETEEYFYFKPIPIETKSTVNKITQTFHDSILIRTPYKNLVKGLVRSDVFDEMFIIRNGVSIFSTLKSDLLIDYSVPATENYETSLNYQELPMIVGNNEKSKPGSTSSSPARIISGEFKEIFISNIKYKVFFKPIKVENEYWYLGGLLETKNFNAASRSIDPWVIVLLSLLLILIVLGLPFIKLKVISKTEHLESGIIISAALSTLLGTSVIILFLLFISQSYSHLRNTNDRLRELSSMIDTTFTREITDIYDQLMDYDSEHDHFIYDSEKPSNKLIYDRILSSSVDEPDYPFYYPFADYIFWINKSGIQSAYFSPFNEKIGEMSDLSSRDYFKMKDEWFFPPDSTRKFRLQSILSITSGNRKVAMSTASDHDENPVIALSSRFYSLIDPIIPRNYGFCIIDESGSVWFHSNKDRNLMENFIDECNKSKNLKAALYSRISQAIDVNYYNKPHRAFIQPLNHLPLYLVTFHNKEYQTSFQAQVFTMGIIFISIFFLLIFLQVIILLIQERQQHRILAKNLIMTITRPMVHLSRHNRFLMWTFLVVAIMTVVTLSFMGKIQSFATIYMVEIIIFTFSSKVLNDNKHKATQTKWFTLINLALLIVVNIGFFVSVPVIKFWPVLAYELILVISLNIAYEVFKSNIPKSRSLVNRAFIRNYAVLLVLMALIFSFLPTMVFYEFAYNTESEVRLRHKQIDLMKQREERNTSWNKYYTSIQDSPYSIGTQQERKNMGVYINFLNNLNFTPGHFIDTANKVITHPLSPLDSLVVFLRPYYDDEIVENKFLALNNQIERHKHWIKPGRDILVLRYLSKTESPKSDRLEYHQITGNIETLNFLTPFHGKTFTGLKVYGSNLIFWLITGLLLYIFYILIKFGIRNIYSLDIVANYTHEPFNNLITHQMIANRDIMMVKLSARDESQSFQKSIQFDLRLNWSDKNEITKSIKRINNCLSDYKSRHETNVDSLEENGKEMVDRGKKKDFVTIFIDHFDWAYTEPGIINKKLDILQAFINHKEIRLLLLSQVHLQKIINYYDDFFTHRKNNAQENEAINQTEISPYIAIQNNLQWLTNNIIISRIPVNCRITENGEETQGNNPDLISSYKELILNELSASDYLSQFIDALEAYHEDYIKGCSHENPEGLLISKINSLAENYYDDLFNSCTAEEQYVMFDLGDDQILNQKNSKAIFGLLEKGLIIKKNDRLSFMNISFQSYVRSKINKVDVAALEIQIGKETGTWQGYKITLLLVIIGLFVFIAMANKDFMENLNQVFILIGGGVAAITGVLGLLSRKSNSISN